MAINNIRDIAKQRLNIVPAEGSDIPSSTLGPSNDGKGDNPLFFTLTRNTHKGLWASWSSSKTNMRTCCNEFVAVYAQDMLGFKQNLGRFDVDQYLSSIGKGHAWVAATSIVNIRPQYGDILLAFSRGHMEVALEFDNAFLIRAAGGQGGPIRDANRKLIGGVDRIKRYRGNSPGKPVAPYNCLKFQGWVDIELFSDPATQNGQVPDWLLGWWTVTWNKQIYYYFFDSTFQVFWTQNAWEITNANSRPTFANDTAKFAVDPPNGVVMRWPNTGTVEKYISESGNLLMQGVTPGSFAVKVVSDPAFGKWTPP